MRFIVVLCIALLACLAYTAKAQQLEAPVVESSSSMPTHMVAAELYEEADMTSLLESALDSHLDNATEEEAAEITALLETEQQQLPAGRVVDAATGKPLRIPGVNTQTLPNEITKDGVKLRKAWVVGQRNPLPPVTRIHRNERVLTNKKARKYNKVPRYTTPPPSHARKLHRTGVKADAQAVDKLTLQKPAPTPSVVQVPVKKTVVHVLREDRRAESAALRSARATLAKINKKRSQLLTGLRALTAARNHVEGQIHRHFVLKAVRSRRQADLASRRAAWSHFLRRRNNRARLLTKLQRWHNRHRKDSADKRRAALAKFLAKHVPAQERAALHSFLRHLRAKQAVSNSKRAEFHARKSVAAARLAADATDEAKALAPAVPAEEVALRVKEAVKQAVLADRLRQAKLNAAKAAPVAAKGAAIPAKAAPAPAKAAPVLAAKARFAQVSSTVEAEAELGVDAEMQALQQQAAQIEAQAAAALESQTQTEMSTASELEAATSTSAENEMQAFESLSAETENEAEAFNEEASMKDDAALQASLEETHELEEHATPHF